ELGGRSTALLALRDGLFRTCEAYANGSIGSAAYALVLSRYGQLMTTLFLAEDLRAAVRSNLAKASSTSSVAPDTTPASTSAGADGGAGTDDKPPTAPQALATPASRQGAAVDSSADGAAAGSAAAPSSTSGTPTTYAALALARMNEDYFALDVDIVHQLIVA